MIMMMTAKNTNGCHCRGTSLNNARKLLPMASATCSNGCAIILATVADIACREFTKVWQLLRTKSQYCSNQLFLCVYQASHKNIKCTALSKCFAGSWQENRSISQERSQMDLLFVRICDLQCEMCSK